MLLQTHSRERAGGVTLLVMLAAYSELRLRVPVLRSHLRLQGQPVPLAGKSVYMLFVDRFARTPGAGGEGEACDGSSWCGGTLAGLLSRVEYIAGMGFDCVWMAPVLLQPVLDQFFVGWCSSGYHGYWVQDFYKIDHRFGSEADLLAVSRALHAHGRCLIILTDWVA